MDTQIAKYETTTLTIPAGADKHTKYRLGKARRWLAAEGRTWRDLDLAVYRDHLLAEGLQGSTVSAHLSTIRGHYRRVITANGTRDHLYRLAAQTTDKKVEQKAFVDEVITRLENAIDPKSSEVKVKVSQDRGDADQLRLSREEAEALMSAPGTKDLVGLRDTAIIALALCTGIREAELSGLEVKDLRQRLSGELALHVREGKGRKERLIPYGQLSWVLALVDVWCEAAGITEGPVFRGLYKDGKSLRPGCISLRAIQYILKRYPIAVDGRLTYVKPHDCRRTYARRLYEAGVDPVAIKQNLGHSSLQTTLTYIGALDVDRRRAPMIYSFDLKQVGLDGM